MNEIKMFENEEFGKVRAVEMEGVPYFIGKDVADILGYSNSRKALIDHVDDEDKKDGVTIRDVIGREQNPVCINESGLYSLILSSKMPTAKKFKRWVTSEVLPNIRKNGGYIANQESMSDVEVIANALTVANRILEERNLKIACQEQKINELQPIVDYTNVILKSPSLVTITQIAKDYGMSGSKLNLLLSEYHIQYKQSGQWLLYSHLANKGYTFSETIDYTDKDGVQRVKMNTKWTQKGRLYIYKVLKKKGILPSIENKFEKDDVEGLVC